MSTQRFAYRLGPRSWPVLRLFGVGGPGDAWVDLDESDPDGALRVGDGEDAGREHRPLADRGAVALDHGDRDPTERPPPGPHLRRLSPWRRSPGLPDADPGPAPPDARALPDRRRSRGFRGGPRGSRHHRRGRPPHVRHVTQDEAVTAPRDGRDPARGGDDVPCLGAPRTGRLRDRHLRRLGGRSDGAGPGRRRHERDVVRRRRRRRARATSTASRSAPADGDLSRMDPYARHVTSSVGNSIVYDPAAFDWGDDDVPDARPGTTSSSTSCTSARSPATDDRAGTFDSARRRLPYLRAAGRVAPSR